MKYYYSIIRQAIKIRLTLFSRQAHVSPHEMLQAVVLCSRKQFQITEQGDAVAFLSWLLNALHLALGGTKKPNSSIIYKTFR